MIRYKCSQEKGHRIAEITSEETGRSPTHTEVAKGVPGSLWAGLRSPATVFLFIQVATPPESASGVPLRTKGQARCEERFVETSRQRKRGPETSHVYSEFSCLGFMGKWRKPFSKVAITEDE